jgi:hypothetical protein
MSPTGQKGGGATQTVTAQQDMNSFRISSLGDPEEADDATKTDNVSAPLPAEGTGNAGKSLLAAPADHVHPAVSGPAILQMGNDRELEVTGSNERVVFQAFVDFEPITSETMKPTLSGIVSGDSTGDGIFNLRLGGMPGTPDGEIVASIKSRSAAPSPEIGLGNVVSTPAKPTMVKVCGSAPGRNSTAHISGIRITMIG